MNILIQGGVYIIERDANLYQSWAIDANRGIALNGRIDFDDCSGTHPFCVSQVLCEFTSINNHSFSKLFDAKAKVSSFKVFNLGQR